MENIGLRICYKLWRKGLVIGIIILFFGTNIIPSTGIIEKERKKEIFADQYEPVILNEKFISFLPEKEDGNGITIFIYDNIYY